MKNRYFIFMFILLPLMGMSCGKDSKTILEEQVITINKKQTNENINFFYKSMKKLEVKVFYQEEAKPYDGKSAFGKEIWNLTEANIKEVFAVREQEVEMTVPKELSEMTKIDDEIKESWSGDEIVELAKKYEHKDINEEEEKSQFSLLFLKGHFRQDGEINKNIIAVSLNGTNVIGVFKDVIKEMADDNERLGKFIEQSTIIHEIGHALGLVNNGVGLTSAHHDEAHGAHCTNDKCVMYWLNEGKQDLIEYAGQIILKGDPILFGDECLQDFKSF